MTYRERETTVPGVVLWHSEAGPAPEPSLILPDGCLDLIWDGDRLFVAGPDTVAQRHSSRPAARYTALRFSGGLRPGLARGTCGPAHR